MRSFHRVVWWINIILAIALLLSYASTEIDPMEFWPLSFFGLSYPILLIANILMILYWLIAKPWRSLLSVGAIILGWQVLTSFINISSIEHKGSTHAVKLMSYNIHNAHWAYTKDKETRKIRSTEIAQFIKKQEVDILCTQETAGFAHDIIMRNKYADNKRHYIKGKGAAIWTKYPIIKKGYVDFGTKTNSCLWADIALTVDTIRVYNVHLMSNQISKISTQMMEGEVALNDKKTWNSIGDILQRYKVANQKRSVQVTLVKKHMETSPYPVILMGDFNDPPSSYTYSQLISGRQDAFAERGVGVSSTYAGSIPLLRIDYIMPDQDFRVLDYELLKVPYSDHYPITSKVVLKERLGN